MVLQEALKSNIYKAWIDSDIVEYIDKNCDNSCIINKLHTVYDIDTEGVDAYIDYIRSLSDIDRLLLYQQALEQESKLLRNKMDVGVAQLALDKKIEEINNKLNNSKDNDKD